MQAITKLVVRAARTQVATTSSISKALFQTRVSAFTQVPRNNFWKKNEKEGEEDVEIKYKAQFEEAAKAEKEEKEAAEKLKKQEAEEKIKKQKEEEDWQKEQDLKDKKREEENKKINEKITQKKLPNKIEDLLKLGSEEAQKKIVSMFNELQENKTKLESQNKILSEEKTSYANQTTQWQEKAKEFKKIVESTLDDMELMRIRLEKEKEQTKIFAITKFAGEVLEVGDNIERALHANKELEGKNNSLFEGTLMTQKILEQILIRNNVVKLNPEGEKFDPNFHDALCQVPDPTKEAGSVAFVAQTGYKIHERVLRPAKVGVTYKV